MLGMVKPKAMRLLTANMTNSAIDKVRTQRAEVEAHLAGYAGTDLLSYRADGPVELFERQKQAWDPILDWIEAQYGARLKATAGVMPVSQDDETLATLAQQMTSMDEFALTGFHDLVALSGSYVLALAVAASHLTGETAWELSRIDEEFQIEQWGRDEEADAEMTLRREAFLHARNFFQSA